MRYPTNFEHLFDETKLGTKHEIRLNKTKRNTLLETRWESDLERSNEKVGDFLVHGWF